MIMQWYIPNVEKYVGLKTIQFKGGHCHGWDVFAVISGSDIAFSD